jgi:hypothetical protein
MMLMKQCANGTNIYPGYGAYWFPKEILSLSDTAQVSIYPRSQFHAVVLGGATNAYVTSWGMAFDSTG